MAARSQGSIHMPTYIHTYERLARQTPAFLPARRRCGSPANEPARPATAAPGGSPRPIRCRRSRCAIVRDGERASGAVGAPVGGGSKGSWRGSRAGEGRVWRGVQGHRQLEACSQEPLVPSRTMALPGSVRHQSERVARCSCCDQWSSDRIARATNDCSWAWYDLGDELLSPIAVVWGQHPSTVCVATYPAWHRWKEATSGARGVQNRRTAAGRAQGEGHRGCC